MKILTQFTILISIVLLSSLRTIAQSDTSIAGNNSHQKIYEFVDKMPEPKEGIKELYNQLSYIKLPNELEVSQSKVLVAFVVHPDGRISGKKVIQDIDGSGIGTQVLRIIENLEWIPGSLDGTPVPVLMKFPFLIHLKE